MITFIKIFSVVVTGIAIYAEIVGRKKDKEIYEGKIKVCKEEGKQYIYTVQSSKEDKMKYISGFKDKGIEEITSIIFTDKDIQINFGSHTRYILEKNITDIYINSEYEIKEKVSAGKILMFGTVGLGMTNKEEEIREYVCIECTYDNYHTTILIKSKFAQRLVQKMRETYLD